jgi:hypothetical protein
MDPIHRTPALDQRGLARCRAHNKLFSWKREGACSVCGVRVSLEPEEPEKNPKSTPSLRSLGASKSRSAKSAKPRRGAKR